jgi:hypothetical protein
VAPEGDFTFPYHFFNKPSLQTSPHPLTGPVIGLAPLFPGEPQNLQKGNYGFILNGIRYFVVLYEN